ncbi:MAG: hypothetical protein IMF08_10835 [Proteobacteria bacterium]|nr:hypothetical protein [Pseudomonadota bacterium]
MKMTDTFPRKVREIENCWITLPDGCKLAARIWRKPGSTTNGATTTGSTEFNVLSMLIKIYNLLSMHTIHAPINRIPIIFPLYFP